MIGSSIFKYYKRIILKILMQIFLYLFTLSLRSHSEYMHSSDLLRGNPKKNKEIKIIIHQLINNINKVLLSAKKTSSDISHHIVVENGKITYSLEILIESLNENVLSENKIKEVIKNNIFDFLITNEITAKGLKKENIMIMEVKARNEDHRKFKIYVTGLDICNGEGDRIEIDMKNDVKDEKRDIISD